MGVETGYEVTQDKIAQYERDGFLVVRGLFSRDEAASLGEHFMAMHQQALDPDNPLHQHYQPVPWENAEGNLLKFYPRMMMPHRFDDLSWRYMLDDRFHSILAALFADEPVAAQSMFYFKPPGARGQALHQDNFYLKVKPGNCLAAWVAIDDGDRENGGMSIVPGSHVIGIQCPGPADPEKYFTSEYVAPPEGMAAIAVDLAAGDVLFFNGSVIHGSEPNSSRDRFRRAFICHYVPQSSTEVSDWYFPLVTFEGRDDERAPSRDGGPCGTAEQELLNAARAKRTAK